MGPWEPEVKAGWVESEEEKKGLWEELPKLVEPPMEVVPRTGRGGVRERKGLGAGGEKGLWGEEPEDAMWRPPFWGQQETGGTEHELPPF